MKLTNTTARILNRPDRKADYDKACKNILSEKSILAWIMKCCLKEYEDCDILDIADNYIEEGTVQTGTAAVHRDEPDAEALPGRINGSGAEDFSETEGAVYFDVRFRARIPKKREGVRLIINVEAQKDFHPGYPLVRRGIFYCARMISSQYETEFSGSHYEDVRKVYSIWICTSSSREKSGSIVKYAIEEEIVAGAARESRVHYDLMSVVMLYLKEDSKEQILRLLHLLLLSKAAPAKKLDILERDYGIRTSDGLERKVEHMCNISEQIEEMALERGMERGMAKGREAGLLESIRSLMGTLKMSAQEAMRALSIPEEDWPKYQSRL